MPTIVIPRHGMPVLPKTLRKRLGKTKVESGNG
jgi:hypothetical protein